MKRNILLLIIVLLIISGCGKSKLETIKEKSEKITEKVQNKINDIEDKIKIPDTLGQEMQKAKETLEKVGFNVKIEYTYDDNVANGQVVKMNPESGTESDKAKTITLYISKGSKNIKVDDYVGLNYIEAKTKLESKGLNVIIEKTEATDDLVFQDSVIRQSIDPDTSVERGTNIVLYIPDIVTKYPDFTDGSYTQSDVQSFCDKYGINLVVENDTEASTGTITSQSRLPGEKIIHNSTLKIKVGIK